MCQKGLTQYSGCKTIISSVFETSLTTGKTKRVNGIGRIVVRVTETEVSHRS